MKCILNVKTTSNLTKCISSHNICSGIKSEQVKKKKPFDIQYQKLLNSSVPFHRVTLDHSISCVLFIDKPNESCKNSKKIERNAISTTKKAWKRNGNTITPVKTNAPISQTSSEGLKLTIQTYSRIGQLQEEISKASLAVSADLRNDFKSIISETDQRKIHPSWA